MGTILDKIVARVQADLVEEKQRAPMGEMRQRAEAAPPPRDFLGALRGPSRLLAHREAKLIAPPSSPIIHAARGDMGWALTAHSFSCTD